jgi:hypothetical protein
MTKIEQYFADIQNCRDSDVFENEFKVKDNWTVILYGNASIVFSKLTRAFQNSPDAARVRNGWTCNEQLSSSRECYFNSNLGVASLRLAKGTHGTYEQETHWIDNKRHSVWVSFHTNSPSLNENDDRAYIFGQVVADVGEYLLREDFTFRIPRGGINLNHIASTWNEEKAE